MRTGTYLFGQRRQAQVDSLPQVALALPVHRLMLNAMLDAVADKVCGAGRYERRDAR